MESKKADQERKTQEQEEKQEQVTPKEIADFIGSIFKAGSVVALILGGWGMLHYCRDNGVPFPAEIPTLIVTVGVVGALFAFVLSGFIFFPALGKEGLLGEEYLWLFAKDEHKTRKFAGFIGVPVVVFFTVFLLDVAISAPEESVEAGVFFTVGIVIALMSVGFTVALGFKREERLKAFLIGLMLALMVLGWSFFALLAAIKLMSWLKTGDNDLFVWAVLIITPAIIVTFLYTVMMPEEQGKEGTRKKWGVAMGVTFAAFLIHPDLSGRLTGYTLKALKLGGGYNTVYILRDDYCKHELSKICTRGDGRTLPLLLMLDTGDRSYVRAGDATVGPGGEEKARLYMIPMRAVVEQVI